MDRPWILSGPAGGPETLMAKKKAKRQEIFSPWPPLTIRVFRKEDRAM
jgi:hypothetical protein